MEEKKDPFDGEYIGNIFGWKLSFIGLGIILFLIALAAYRHHTMDVPLGFDDPLINLQRSQDTLPPSNDSLR